MSKKVSELEDEKYVEMSTSKRDNSNFVNVVKEKYKSNSRELYGIGNNSGAFDKSLDYILKEVKDLKRFDWVNCIDDELIRARGKIVKLKKVFSEVPKLIR